MKTEHLAIDGSVVSIEADADLSTQCSASGWAIVPSLMRAHPFSSFPAGHSETVEKAVRSEFPDTTIKSIEDYSLKGGTLRIAEVELPTATNGKRTLVLGAWEGSKGCLTTSLSGSEADRLIEIFDTLQFRESSRGIMIESPVTPRPREPAVVKEIPRLGILNIQPAIPSTLEGVPRASGYVTDNGELFRLRKTSNALLFVGGSAVVRIDTPTKTVRPETGLHSLGAKEKAMPASERERDTSEIEVQEMLAIAESLRVEWIPRRSRR